MSTPTLPGKNSFRQVDFYTLAGVSKAELKPDGEEIVVIQKNPLPECRVEHGRFLCTEFVNWPADAPGVLRFTRHYGALTAPLTSGAKFSFSVADWKKHQQMVRDYWEFAQACHEQLNFRNHGTGGVEFIPVASNEEFVCLADKLRYKAASLFRFILLEFNSIPFERLRKCKLLGCSTPHFVAGHLGQRYCSSVCARSIQSQWKKNWWDQSGKAWRKNRANKSSLTNAEKRRGGK